jgi:pimeloyl-ACP methyl ester carboxylesterase
MLTQLSIFAFQNLATMKKITFRQKQLAYRIHGQGPAMVFLHGFPMDHRVWEIFTSVFSKQFTVICPDLPGFGQSEMIQDEHHMWLMAEAVNAILAHEEISKALFVGHSMGGYAALALAKQYPERVSGLVLFHSHAAEDEATARANRANAIVDAITDIHGFIHRFIDGLFDAPFKQKYPERVDRIQKIAESQRKEAVTAAIAGLRDRESQLQLLSELNCPVVFILGKNDSRMPFARILAQVALPSHAELMLLSGVAHMGFEETPDITKQAILHFALRCQNHAEG